MTTLTTRRGLFRSVVAAITTLGLAGPAMAQDAVSISTQPMRGSAKAGQTLPLAVILDHAPHYHSWPSKDQDVLGEEFEFAERTSITITGHSDQVSSLGAIQWPEPSPAPVPNPVTWIGTVDAPVYQGKAVAYVPVNIASDAEPGLASISIDVYYQVCDETTCLAPETVSLSVEFQVVGSSDSVGEVTDAGLFANYKSSAPIDTTGDTERVEQASPPQQDSESATDAGQGAVPQNTQASGSSQIPIDFLGYFFYVKSWMMLPIAFAAGLILNLTPCVLPVIPLKVMSIQQHAKEPTKLAIFGTAYCLGIVAVFGVLAVLVGIFGQAWGQLNGYIWFSIPLAAIVAAMGLSMLGLFTISLPQSMYMVNPSADSTSGNFLLGGLTAILSTPCTGPMLGAVLAWSATQPTWVGISFVLLMGVGMAAPYALLIAFPSLVDKMPRTGPGSELMKQVLGLLMLAVAAYVLSFLTSSTWTWWFVGLFAAAAFVWMYFAGLRALQTTNGKILVTHGAILGLLVTFVMTRAMTGSGAPTGTAASAGQIQWVTFKGPGDGDLSEFIDQSLAEGHVVVIDFTAKWCANCHVIEKQILNSLTGRTLLTMDGVIAIKVDITDSGYAQALEVLAELSGAGSIPFLAVMGPERPRNASVTFRSFFKPADLRLAMEQAWGGPFGNATELVRSVGPDSTSITPVGHLP